MILIIKHAEIEGPGTIDNFFSSTAREMKIVELQRREPLPSINECEAIISLGGPMNVYEVDKYPFLIKEERLLKEAIAKEVPFLGICLGAQLLAKVAGARVHKAAQSEIGWYTIELTDGAKEDVLFKNLPTSFETFQWHEDTFALPATGTLLATAPTCKNQALGVGRCAWGLQFHPEMTEEMIEEWGEAQPPSLDVDKLLLEYSKNRHTYSKVAHQLYLNFAQVINHHSAIRT